MKSDSNLALVLVAATACTPLVLAALRHFGAGAATAAVVAVVLWNAVVLTYASNLAVRISRLRLSALSLLVFLVALCDGWSR